MYQTLSFAPVLDYKQEDRNLSDNMLARPYDPVQRYREQVREQDQTREYIRGTYPVGVPEPPILYEQVPIVPVRNEHKYVMYTNPPVNDSPQFPKWPVNILITIAAIIILSLVLAIVAIIALLRKH